MKISPRACFCAGEELESSGSSSVEKTVKINHRGRGEHRELWFLLCVLCELCGLYTKKNRSKMHLMPTGGRCINTLATFISKLWRRWAFHSMGFTDTYGLLWRIMRRKWQETAG
ncbi:MAG: hypothetical protein L6263_13125 [Desulfobacteraceae bacterium]|nr:hypothetical protein [Desulfobacteraceae bacterium]